MTDPFMPKPEHIQGTPEWLEMRRNFIGASEVPAIMGESPWTTSIGVWEQKVGIAPPIEENAAMRRGTALEPIARAAFERETGLEVFPQVVYHPDYDFMLASLDGLTIDGTQAVEIKCPGAKTHAMALEGKVPPHYIGQLMHQMACAGLEDIWYYSFDGEQGVALKVERDPFYIDMMIVEEIKFWECVQDFVPPRPTDKDYDDRDGPRWSAIGGRLAEIEEQLKSLENEKESLKVELISDAQGRSCKGGGIILTRSFRKGQIDYGAIPQLNGVDLSQYRKPAKETWTLKTKKGK